MVTRVQTLDEAACISHKSHIRGKGINSIILLSAKGKYQDRQSSLTLVWQPTKEKENSELKPAKLH